MYGIGDGKLIHRFPAGSRVHKFDVSEDEKFLIVACDRAIGAWDLISGLQLWSKGPNEAGIEPSYDISLAWNGKSFVVCNERDFALVYETHNGQQISKIEMPPGRTSFVSAALSPDGSRGVFVTMGGQLFTFDVAEGAITDTGIRGDRPVRYSANGKYITMQTNNWSGAVGDKTLGGREQFRIVPMPAAQPTIEVGRFNHVGQIRPTSDGGFIATVEVKERNEVDTTFFIAGLRYEPQLRQLTEVWKLPTKNISYKADFDPEAMLSVSTDFKLVTRLIDLRTGKTILTVDNSANARLEEVSSSWGGENGWGGFSVISVVVLSMAMLVIVIALIIFFQRWCRPSA
jgi:hypothetical protein